MRTIIFMNSLVYCIAALALAACDRNSSCYRDQLTGPITQNHPPSIQAQSDTNLVFGDTLKLRASATDPDGDDLTYYLTVFIRDISESDYVADAFLDSLTGDFWFVPGPMDMPDRSMMFTVIDEKGYSASTQFKVAVKYYLDQVCDLLQPDSFHNIVHYRPVGQEFVPNISALDIVQVWLEVDSPADLIVNIRSGTITGPIEGTSEVLTFPGRFNGIATFEFERVDLVPQEMYVIELVQQSGQNCLIGYRREANYPYGRFILNGTPWEYDDAWFREGVGSPYPEESNSGDLGECLDTS
ncbi:MAG: hypothetical protein GTO51_00395 [Candidatus Latescibacteria bacterium]|nr:hypothetical protein [Candidatus Latescibacterota bacterium]NIM64441.1 hypothetical protein [Candidatus Latescibacterota bacterium]NIO00595.1 hypothetical protein [Candidatus Latescibacterota bacterium]NIO26995.1 hypothetical protein [Candidatus Latescibacterota bacterium]NIO56072.1 hypothetical protein [Candidatus Latescibacterota bacterium]